MSSEFRPVPSFRLYAVTDRSQVPGGGLAGLVSLLAGAGLKGLQLREKDLKESQLVELASAIRPAMEVHGVQWMLNGPVSAVSAAGASGIHLSSSVDVRPARARLGQSILIGKSIHSLPEAGSAVEDGADFLLFGPVFDTPSKWVFGPPQGIERLREVCESVDIPVYAVGGISPERAAECLKAGARGVAVISGLMTAKDPVEALKKYGRELGGL